MNRGFLPFIVGGLLLGSGLDLAGTCPGMVYVEVSENKWLLQSHSNGWFFLPFTHFTLPNPIPIPIPIPIHSLQSNH